MKTEEISEIYVSQCTGYFIGDDLKNALEITNEFIAKEFKTKQIVIVILLDCNKCSLYIYFSLKRAYL